MMVNIKNKGMFQSLSEFEFKKDPKRNKLNLGVGSFGEVKLALHKQTQRFFAIKIMNLKSMNNRSEIEAIEREIRVHFQLNHPNIIKLYDAFTENNYIYMVMEWAQNGNLYSYLYKKKYLKEEEAFQYFHQTCKAIEYLHDQQILHRDIKPENLLLDQNNNIKLCDFGWISEDFEEQRNTFCGTYEYMAPEIVFNKSYDYRIDLWALGILMYELLHGQAPFKGKSFKEVQQKIREGDVTFSAEITNKAKYLMARILQSDPVRRIRMQDIYDSDWVKDNLQRKFQINRAKSDSIQKQISDGNSNQTTIINECQNQQTLKKNYRMKMKLVSAESENSSLHNKDISTEETQVQEEQQFTTHYNNLNRYLDRENDKKSQKPLKTLPDQISRKITLKISPNKEIQLFQENISNLGLQEQNESKSKPLSAKQPKSLQNLQRKYSNQNLLNGYQVNGGMTPVQKKEYLTNNPTSPIQNTNILDTEFDPSENSSAILNNFIKTNLKKPTSPSIIQPQLPLQYKIPKKYEIYDLNKTEMFPQNSFMSNQNNFQNRTQNISINPQSQSPVKSQKNMQKVSLNNKIERSNTIQDLSIAVNKNHRNDQAQQNFRQVNQSIQFTTRQHHEMYTRPQTPKVDINLNQNVTMSPNFCQIQKEPKKRTRKIFEVLDTNKKIEIMDIQKQSQKVQNQPYNRQKSAIFSDFQDVKTTYDVQKFQDFIQIGKIQDEFLRNRQKTEIFQDL